MASSQFPPASDVANRDGAAGRALGFAQPPNHMHGIIFVELKKYVETRVSQEAWRAVHAESAVTTKAYLAMQTYPDAELVALVQTASTMTGTPMPALLKDFGTFIVPDLLKTYRAFMRPEWRTLDVLEFTESEVHAKVRTMTKGAMPPFLESARTSANEVLLTYRSARRLCAVGEGIIVGIADHFQEKITLTHEPCMLQGAPACEMRVTLTA